MNIVGFWTGQYAYDAITGLVVEFHAELGQLGDTLSGQSTEKNTFSTGAGQILIADLFGTVSRSSIDFTKQYTNAAPGQPKICLLYTSPSPRDQRGSRMPSSA